MNPLTNEQKRLVSERIKEFRQVFAERECLHPSQNCPEPGISSHTISKSGSLEKIAKNGEVYSFLPIDPWAYVKQEFTYHPKLVGISRVSVFNGFCAEHDCQLFLPLDNQEFTATSEQNALLAYRALSKELYVKCRQIRVFPTFDQVVAIQKHADRESFEHFRGDFLLGATAGVKDLKSLKDIYDKVILTGDFRRIQNFVVMFKHQPTVLVSSFYFPDYSFDGAKLQDLGDMSKGMDSLALNVFPVGNGGAAVFSWLDSQGNAPKSFCQSLHNLIDSKKTDGIITLLLEYCENIAISPAWWDSLDQTVRNALLDRYQHGSYVHERQSNVLDVTGVHFGDWEPTHAFFL